MVARAVACAGAATAIGLALFALANWRSGNLGALGGLRGNVPIAPGTALLLLLLGVALALEEFGWRQRAARAAGVGMAVASILLAGDVCIRGFAGIESWWEPWLLGTPEVVRGIPLGRTSPFTAVLIVLSGLPLVIGPARFVSRDWIRGGRDLAAGTSAVVAALLLLGYAAGAPLFYGSGLIPVALLTAAGVLGLDAGLLADRVNDLLTSGRRAAAVPAATGQPRCGWRREIAFSAVAALIVVASGIGYLRLQLAAMRQTASRELAAIRDLKVEAIAAWRAERIQDASYFTRVPAVARALVSYLDHAGDEAAKEKVAGFLRPMQETRAYAGLVILDGTGEPRLSIPEAFHPDAGMLRIAREALVTRTVAVGDLRDGAVTPQMRMDLAAPMVDPDGGRGSRPIGVIVIRVNAGAELARMIGSWPIPSESAETLLARRENGAVVFLSALRHRAEDTRDLHFPADDPDLPAAMAARGEIGVYEGIDYRGVRVLAAIGSVPGTPWGLVAKVDQQEIYAPLRRQTGAVVLVVFALLLATGFWTETIWRRRVAGMLELELEAERRYRELAERFALITRYGSDVILMADEQGHLVEANERAVEAYGFSREQLRAMTQREIRAPEARAQLEADLARAGAAGGGLFETLHARRDGTAFPVEVNYRPVRIGGQTFRLEFIRDITRRKRDEEERRRFASQLEQTQRLESLGVMAGGIAHDFNNLLTTILGRTGILLLDVKEDSPLCDGLKEIEHASERAAGLCRQMLAYAGKGQTALEALSLSRLVDEMVNLLNVSIPAPITFRRRLDQGIPLIKSDATQVRQVIMNLVVNAAEAIGERAGVIEVSTGVVECDEADLRADSPLVPPAPGRFVYLEVSDTGGGMDAPTQARIFDPFFTTKAAGRGLGLPAVLGIVLNNRGSLKVKSEPGKGSTFRVLFPVTKNTQPPAA